MGLCICISRANLDLVSNVKKNHTVINSHYTVRNKANFGFLVFTPLSKSNLFGMVVRLLFKDR